MVIIVKKKQNYTNIGFAAIVESGRSL